MSRLRSLGDRRDIVIGAVVLLSLPILVALIFSGRIRSALHHEDAQVVRATFANAQQVRTGNYVRIDGAKAGTVDAVSLDPSHRTTTVRMKVDRSSGPIYDDARATLRFRTVLGGTFYIDLDRGTPGHHLLGDRAIPVSRTEDQVEVDDITSVFNRRARQGLQDLPPELADAMRDHRAPARLLAAAADASPGIRAGTQALRGTRPDRDLEDLVANTARTLRALRAPHAGIRAVVQGAAATLSTTAARADDIRALLRLAHPANHEINATLDRLRTTLDVVDPLVGRLQRPAGAVKPTFDALRPVLGGADGLLDRAVPLLDELRPTARSLARTAHSGRDVLDGLTVSIKRLDHTLLPALAEVDPVTQKSTAVMIGGTFAALGSGAGGQMDVNGHFIRFPATTGSSPVNSLPCQIYLNNPDHAQLLACKSLSSALSTYLNYAPLGPTPGTAGAPRHARGAGR
jgi:phospholipid/cholesterol/gamma-HCH transport system substrate-binding protein